MAVPFGPRADDQRQRFVAGAPRGASGSRRRPRATIVPNFHNKPRHSMAIPNDAFRRFQEELAALERTAQQRLPEATSPDAVRARAKSEFLALRERYGLSVADVIAFFPEEEGIEFLRQVIAESDAKPARSRKRQSA